MHCILQPHLNMCFSEVQSASSPVFRLLRVIGMVPKLSPYCAVKRWEVVFFQQVMSSKSQWN